ncbi:MAG: endolytic transglycosylase MltG [Citrobacter freundii]|nr:MAG: endolytic transglycosylase MltG [Citrobacter freundii]
MKKKILLIIAAFILLVAAFFGWNFLGPTLHTPDEKFLYVRTGATYKDVTDSLISNKIVGSTTWFNMAAKMAGYKNIKPGRYEIKRGMSVLGLVRMLKNGSQTPVNFIITKIRTREVLAGRIGRSFECDSTEMLAFLNNADSLQQFGLDTNTVMVAAMPLTYTLKWNSTPSRIFREFHNAWTTFWTAERKKQADSIGLNPVQVSILASILDEETNSDKDRPNIASVYLNRLRTGMPLQADPTVKFALRNFALRRIYEKQLLTESPYNTYVHKGLPPGPICTPAEHTIDAVLTAPKTDYLYFVASSAFDGTHVFTSNYKDHMAYARLYQKELNNRNVK